MACDITYQSRLDVAQAWASQLSRELSADAGTVEAPVRHLKLVSNNTRHVERALLEYKDSGGFTRR